MEMSTPAPSAAAQQVSASKSGALLLVFDWKSNSATVTEEGAADGKPTYTASLKTFTTPHVTYKAADGSVFGTGNVHLISINADCTFNDKPIKLEAQRRLKTAYTHQSQVLRNDKDKPAQLFWKTETDYRKTWTFLCLDEVQQPIMKLEYNVWALKKFGRIEFAEGRTISEELRRELVITSSTLVYCMIVRMNNIFNLVGSVLHRKSKVGEPQQIAG